MKSMKTLLAVIMAVCMMMSLAIPTFATETTEGTAEAVTEEVTEAVTEEVTEEATGETEETSEDIELPIEDEEDHAGHDHEHETTGEAAEGDSLSVLQIILIVFEVIASLALICVVLMQSGKESGLSGALSGNSDSYMSKGGRANLDKKLASATKWIALVWVLLTLALCLV